MLGFIMAMVLIASGFAISFYSYNQYSQDMQRVRHTYEVIGTLQNVLSSVKDVETGSRGYVITNDSLFLQPYRLGMRQLPEHTSRLRHLNSENRIQVQNQVQLEKLIQAKLDAVSARIATKLTNERNLAVAKEGKRRMDLIRQHVAMMTSTEQTLMEMRNKQAERSFRNTILIIFAVSLLTLLTLVISYRLLEQELVRRQQNEDQLRDYEVKLKAQIRQLEASNEELERFAFVASHDLQEPLRKIQSFSNLITDRYGNLFDADSTMFMSKIANSAARMSKLIKDLLNFSRISNHQEHFKPVSLNDIVRRILDDQELRIKGLNVRVEMGNLPVVPAVSSQMDHLFNNLISNALKFIRPGVQPLLRIQAKSIDGSAYEGLMADESYVQITVEDNGIGFDEKYRDHIFKVFQRLHGKSAFEGTGIGLAICKRVVLYHNGYITAHSQLNEGSTFVVVLPERQLLHNYDRPTSAEAYSYPAG